MGSEIEMDQDKSALLCTIKYTVFDSLHTTFCPAVNFALGKGTQMCVQLLNSIRSCRDAP